MKDRFRPHPKNPDILVGKTYKLKENPYKEWATTDRRILEEKAKQGWEMLKPVLKKK